MYTSKLQEKCEKLEEIIRNTLWMARRYADQRSTYAPSVVNISIQETKDRRNKEKLECSKITV